MAGPARHPGPEGEALPAHLERLRLLAWLGFAFTLPPRWEITAYALANAGAGRLQFHQEERECGELSWRAVDGTPDLPRMIRATLAGMHGLSGGAADAHQASIIGLGEWLVGTSLPGRVVAMLWQAGRARILQWALTADGGDLEASELGRLLLSFSPNAELPRRWRLFGAGCRLPADFAFERLAALPGHVAMIFQAPSHARVAVRRIGLVAEVLREGGGMAGLYRRLLAQEGQRLLEIVEEPLAGHPAVRAEFERRGQRGAEALMGSWWKGRGWMWHDQAEDRLYAVEQVGPAATTPLEISDVID